LDAVDPPQASEATIKEFTQILAGLHAVIAIGLQAPEIILSEEEAARLGASIANVARFYAPLDLTGKKGALLGLGVTCVVVYGPKLVTMAVRKARPKTPPPHPSRAAEDMQEAAE
jgi:hypothetical protein